MGNFDVFGFVCLIKPLNKQSVVIWDALAFMQCHCNEFSVSRVHYNPVLVSIKIAHNIAPNVHAADGKNKYMYIVSGTTAYHDSIIMWIKASLWPEMSFHKFKCVKNTSVYVLTHWGRETHICVGNLTIIDSDNGLSPGQRQAIIWTNSGLFLIGPLGTYFNAFIKRGGWSRVLAQLKLW